MSIESTYRKILLERFLEDRLKSGQLVDIADVKAEAQALLDNFDYSTPQFSAQKNYVEKNESSSVGKTKAMFREVREDLTALFLNLFDETQKRQDAFERWRIESDLIERSLQELDNDIENLLLLTRNTEGLHAVISETFPSAGNVDLDLTTTFLDLNAGQVELAPSSNSFSRIFLNNIQDTDATFKVRSTSGSVARNDLKTAKVSDTFKQDSRAWGTTILTKSDQQLTCELLVKLGESPVEINKIFIELHDAVYAGDVTITPLLSIDLRTFNQLPSRTYTAEVRDRFSFVFSSTEAKWVKFILTKQGPDSSAIEGVHSYLFGFKSIAFYNSGYDVSDTAVAEQTFVSQPRYALDFDGGVLQFEKMILEACEALEENTDIRYFVTTSLDPSVPVDATTKWLSISPISRVNSQYPRIVSVGDLSLIEIGLNDEVTTSYTNESLASDSAFVNPAESFHLFSLDSNFALQDDVVQTASNNFVRYEFAKNDNRMLNYQIKSTSYTGSGGANPINVNLKTLEVLRNVGKQGVQSSNPGDLVREVCRGWRFEDPYFVTVVEIVSPNGMSVDTGNIPIMIDGVSHSGQIPPSVLTGKTIASNGRHLVKIHKQFWSDVKTGANSVQDLRELDKLYPYNPRLLIEGYVYGSAFSESKVYNGVDLFYERLMMRVGVFDFNSNTQSSDLSVYALGLDAPNTHTGGNEATTVFLVKIDPAYSDSQQEHFVVRFKQANKLHQYLRLRADLKTTSPMVTPVLQGYKIKLG